MGGAAHDSVAAVGAGVRVAVPLVDRTLGGPQRRHGLPVLAHQRERLGDHRPEEALPPILWQGPHRGDAGAGERLAVHAHGEGEHAVRRDELVARESPESPLGRPIEVAPVPAAHVRLQREVLRLNIRVVLVDALDLVLRGGGCRGRGAGRAHVGGEGAEALHLRATRWGWLGWLPWI